MPDENIEEILMDTPNMAQQNLENEALRENVFVPISEKDYDVEHLVAMGTTISTEASEVHRLSHIQSMIQKGTMQMEQNGQENAMSNAMNSQAMSQAGSQLSQ